MDTTQPDFNYQTLKELRAKLKGTRVRFCGAGAKFGMEGTVSDILKHPSGFKYVVSFDSTPKYQAYHKYLNSKGFNTAFTYSLSPKLGLVSQFIEVIQEDKTIEETDHIADAMCATNNLLKEKTMDPTINVTANFNSVGAPREVQNEFLASLEPEEFLLVCDGKGIPKYRLNSSKKGMKAATKIAANLAVDSKDKRGIFYVMKVVSAHQVEQRPVIETNFED